MGEARRRQLAGEYPKYAKLKPKWLARDPAKDAKPMQARRNGSFLAGHGQQIARRDGRA